MGRKQKGNGPAAQQDDGEASGQLQDDGSAAGRRRDDGAAAGRQRDEGGMTERPRDDGGMTEKTRDDGGMMCHVEEQELKGLTMFLMPLFHLQRGPFRGFLSVESSVRCRKRSRRIPQL